MKHKLFRPKPPEQNRSKRLEIRATEKEAKDIQFAADIRQMTVAEFMRRAALGRRADVRYEVEIVLALSNVISEIRDLHAAVVKTGILPPENEWRPIITKAIEAMKRIDK